MANVIAARVGDVRPGRRCVRVCQGCIGPGAGGEFRGGYSYAKDPKWADPHQRAVRLFAFAAFLASAATPELFRPAAAAAETAVRVVAPMSKGPDAYEAA